MKKLKKAIPDEIKNYINGVLFEEINTLKARIKVFEDSKTFKEAKEFIDSEKEK